MIRNFFMKILFSAIFILLFSTKFVDVTVGERLYEYPLETAWKATGIPLQEIDIEAWMKLNDRRLTLYELREIAGRIQKKLNLRLKTGMITGEQDDFCYLAFEGTQPNGTSVTITIQSSRFGEISETQLGVNTIHIEEVNNLREYIRDFREKLAGLGEDLDFNVVFIGEHKGKIPAVLVRELSGRAFRKLKAELVNSAFEEDSSIQRGLSGLIKEKVEIDACVANVEFSTRYDRARNITQIILAAPRAIGGV